jgi:hypothetical protein
MRLDRAQSCSGHGDKEKYSVVKFHTALVITGFEIFMTMKILFVMLCSSVGVSEECITSICRVKESAKQEKSSKQSARSLQLACCLIIAVCCLNDSSTLKMEADVPLRCQWDIYRTTQHYILEDHTLQDTYCHVLSYDIMYQAG